MDRRIGRTYHLKFGGFISVVVYLLLDVQKENIYQNLIMQGHQLSKDREKVKANGTKD